MDLHGRKSGRSGTIKNKFGDILQIEAESPKELFESLGDTQNIRNARVLILYFADEVKFAEEAELRKPILEQIKNLPIPVILIVKDSIKDFVFDILLASHLCIAADSAKFEIKNFEAVKKQIGSKNRDKLSSHFNEINAEKALDLGFINKVVASEDLESEAFELAEKIADLAPLAIRSCLQAVNRGLEMSLEDGLKLETELFTKIFATEDMKEGTNAFLEKRKPNFRGS